jgi:hypothetical protein
MLVIPFFEIEKNIKIINIMHYEERTEFQTLYFRSINVQLTVSIVFYVKKTWRKPLNLYVR